MFYDRISGTVTTNNGISFRVPLPLTQCTHRLNASVLAWMRVLHSSGMMRAVAGPAPKAKVYTYLKSHTTTSSFIHNNDTDLTIHLVCFSYIYWSHPLFP